MFFEEVCHFRGIANAVLGKVGFEFVVRLPFKKGSMNRQKPLCGAVTPQRGTPLGTRLHSNLIAFSAFAREKRVGFIVANDLTLGRIPIQFASQADGDVR
jgi:hypothetical protein